MSPSRFFKSFADQAKKIHRDERGAVLLEYTLLQIFVFTAFAIPVFGIGPLPSLQDILLQYMADVYLHVTIP